MNNTEYCMTMVKSILKDFENADCISGDARLHNFLINNGFVINNGSYLNSFFNDQLSEIIFVRVKPYNTPPNSIEINIVSANKEYKYDCVYDYNEESYPNINNYIASSILDAVLSFVKRVKENNKWEKKTT